VKRQQLDSNLARVRSEGSREPIRLALKDLGLFFQETGDSSNAVKVLFQGKDSSSTQQQHLEMALLVMDAGLDFAKYDYASPFAQKAEQLLPPQLANAKPSNEFMRIRFALGLCDLDRKRYKAAAKNLLQINSDFKYPSLASLEDVATIATLCAMATFSRNELKENLVENVGFKPMLELVPVLKELLTNFISSSYGPLIKTLGAALPLLSVDPFLHSHAETIVKDIKVQALLQCTLPYSSLKLEKIANAFDMDVAEIEVELAQLISSGRIQARIDSQSRTLVARGDDKRDVGIRGALEASEHIVAESRAMLLRVNLLENFVVYTPAKASSRSAKAAAPSMLAQAESGERDEGESENEDLMEDMRSD